MIKRNIKKSLGEISPTLLILGAIILVGIIGAVIFFTIFQKPPPPLKQEKEEAQGPIYEVVIGDIKFKLQEAKDIGNILKISESKYPELQRGDLTTAEKFIEVMINAENVGKETISAGYWEINELTDSEGRKFYYSSEMDPWIPEESKCGASLKPGFTPTLCKKIYEVAKISTGLKVKVSSKQPLTGLPGEGLFIDLGL